MVVRVALEYGTWEHFLEGQDFLNECSFRLTYGNQGNANEAASPDLIARIAGDNEGGIVRVNMH